MVHGFTSLTLIATAFATLPAHAQVSSPASQSISRGAGVKENRSFVYHGKIVRPDGSTPTGSMSVTLKILSPDPNLCILWTETQTINMQEGQFTAELGHTVHRLPGAAGGAAANFKQAFVNNPSLTISGAQCATGNSYTPTASDDRLLTATFNDSGSVIEIAGLPIKSVPFALQAEEIAGFGIANIAKISGAGSSVTYSPAEIATLKDMLGGDVFFDMKSRAVKNVAAPTDPNDAANKSWVLSQISSSGGGTVSSVGFTAPSIFGVSGSPVTSSGSIGLTLANQAANSVFAGPTSGGAAAPTFRALDANDIPALDAAKITSGTFTTTQIPSLDAAKIGSGTLAGARIPSLDASKISTGTLPAARGGTGLVPAVGDGNKVYGLNAAGTDSEFKALTAGSGVTISHSANTIQISASGSGGTVTNVTGSGPISVANNTTTPSISIAQANTTTAGYLSAADWNTFNNKQPAGAYLTSITSGNVTTALGFTPISNALATGQVYLGVGGVATASNFGIGQMRNNVGTLQMPTSCTAAQTLTWNAVNDVLACTNIAIAAGAVSGLGGLATKNSVDLSTGDATGNLASTRISGVLGAGSLGTGTADATKYLRGDGTWQTLPSGADHLGNHTATQNLNLATYQLVGNGGSSGIAITSGGNVGIGTTSPGSNLEVRGTLNVSSSNGTTKLSHDTFTSSLLYNGGNNELVIGRDGGNRNMYLHSNGGVTIGNGGNGPGANGLTVVGNIMFGNSGVEDGRIAFTPATRTMEAGSPWTTGVSGYALNIAGSAAGPGTDLNGGDLNLSGGTSKGSGVSSIIFNTATPGASGTATRASSEKMRITGSGNVGIGTTSPSEKLEVVGGKIKSPEFCIGASCITAWPAVGGGGTVTSVGVGGLPLSVTSASTTPTITIAQANTSTAGYLSATDWNTFNNKQPAGAYLTSISSGNVTTALGYTPLSQTLAANQVLVGNGSNVATASFFGIEQMRNASGVAQFPSACTASQTLTWSAITDTLSCTNINNLNADKITAGTIATARLGSGTADGTTFLRGDGTWAVPSGSGTSEISFAASLSATQSLPTNTWTKVTHGNEIFDTANAYNPTTGRFQPATAGRYMISAQIYLGVQGGRIAAGIAKNGTIVANQSGYSAGGNPNSAHITEIVELNGTTDYVEVQAYQETGATNSLPVAGHAHVNHFQGFRIGGGGGGSGTPGGSTTQLQFNDAGSFAGASGLAWDKTNSRLGIGTTTPQSPLEVTGVIHSTTGGIKFPDGSVQLSSATSGTNNSMVSGWPDVIICNVTNPAVGPMVFTANLMPYSGDGIYYYRSFMSGINYSLLFNGAGTFNSYQNLTTTNCNTTISANIAAGRAFNIAKGPSGQWLEASGNAYRTAGFVGVGTSSPTYNLHLNSSNTLSAISLTNSANSTANGSTNGFFLGGAGADAYIANRENGPMYFWTNNAFRMVLDATGNVGIGTTTPSAKLEVTGNVKVSGTVSNGSSWTNLSLVNSWVSYGSGYPPASYKVDVNGRVWLRGLIMSGATGTAAATLPVGARPGYAHEWSVACAGTTPCEIYITTAGVVFVETGNSGWTSLDGISFEVGE